jgi:hypothetical protein
MCGSNDPPRLLRVLNLRQGHIELHGEVAAVDSPFVSFRDTHAFLADGAVITSDSTLRFRGRDEMESILAAEGYRILDVWEALDRPGRELVFIARPEPNGAAFRPGTPASGRGAGEMTASSPISARPVIAP